MTVRRRAMLALLILVPVGWLYAETAWRLLGTLLIRLTGHDRVGTLCGGSGIAGVIGEVNGCNSYSYHYGLAIIELVLGTAILVGIVYALGRWVTAPLRAMTTSVERLGPNNLAQRIELAGSSKEETKRLADSIDRMLDRVAEGYEAQRRFAANASHELRTPLATQRALIEVSLGSGLTDDQLELLTRQLLSTNERNERLIDGLLTLAETDRGLATSGPVRLDQVVVEATESLRPSAKLRDLELSVVATPVSVIGERPLLERLVTNLVQNAVKYNDPGGSVIVNVTQTGVLTVANTGPVVPAEAVGGLFEPFRRLSGERLDHGGGVGLGLTIARSIVAAHHGAITAHANPGGGLVVEVRLAVA